MSHKRPHIQVQVGPRWNSLVGFFDIGACGARWWECINEHATGSGATPKEAYANWNRELLRPYQNSAAFMAAYRSANTPR